MLKLHCYDLLKKANQGLEMNKKPLLVIMTSIALLQSPVARSDGDTVMQLITNRIAEAADSIKQVASVEAMQAAIQKVIQDTSDTSSQKEIAAQGQVADGLSQTEIDVANQDKVFWMTPDIGTCDRRQAKASIDQASKRQEQLRAYTNGTISARIRGSSSGGGSKIGPLKYHDDSFCAQADVDRKYCSSVSKYADFDLNAANFIQPKNNTYDPTEQKAAALFIANATIPTPLPQLQPNLSTSSIEVQKYREAHNAYAARMSTANEALSDVFADNAPPDTTAGSKGLFQLIKEQVEGRSMGDGGAAFTTALTKGGPGTAARSAAEMESMTNLLLLKIWESERRQQVLLGQLVSVISHQDMEAQILSKDKRSGTDAPQN
jgi:hypothetical protein